MISHRPSLRQRNTRIIKKRFLPTNTWKKLLFVSHARRVRATGQYPEIPADNTAAVDFLSLHLANNIDFIKQPVSVVFTTSGH